MKLARKPSPRLWRWAGLGMVLFGVMLSAPMFRYLIERSMVWHMVIQMPALLAGGWLCASSPGRSQLGEVLSRWNRYGLTGFMTAQVILAYWMLPLAIDRAVVLPSFDALKLASLMLAGAALGASIRNAPLVLQLFFVGYSVSMLSWLGLYFATTDLRLCNAYSLASQAEAGRDIVALAVVVGCAWLIHAVRRVGWPAWEAYLRA